MGSNCAKWLEAVCATLIKSAERRAPSAECRAPSAERRAPSAERRAPSAERRAPSAERRAPSAERRAPSAERRAPSAEAMTAPRAREQSDPPAPSDRRPPRRGGRPSAETYSAAGRLRGLVRSGRRAVLAVAGLTAIVLATGLALAPPAQAQETIWSGTVTVGASGSVLGFLAPNCAGCTGYGSLSDRTFSYDGTNYNIRILDHTTNSPHWLRIRTLSNGFTSKTVADLYLVVDGVNFLLSDGSSSQSGKQRTWNNAGLNWSVGTDVSVSLKKFNRPELDEGTVVRRRQQRSR